MSNFLKALKVKGIEIDTAGAITGDVLKYDGTKFGAASAGGSSVGDLDDLSDVVITSPLQFQGLMYDGTNWVNSNIPDVYLVRNNTGSTLLKGTLVGAVDAEPSGRIDVEPFEVTGTQNSELRAMGIVVSNISSGVNGEVMSFGTLTGLDTRGSTASALAVGDETWAAGDILFAHPTVNGKLTNVRPQHDLAVALITVLHASTGQIAIRIIPGNNHLAWMHDVAINAGTLATGDVIRYNASTSLWENSQVVGPTGPTGATGPQGLGYVIGTAELAEEDPESGNWSFKVSSVGAFASGDYVRVEEDSSNYILGTCYAISFFSGSYYMAVAPDVTVGTPDFDPSFSVHLAGETGASGVMAVSDTAPGSPSSGNLWFKSDTGAMYVYYDSFWIEVGTPSSGLDGGSA
jgi:hypothetical protein